MNKYSVGKGNVFYGQEPPSGESTTTECGVNYQLLAVMLLQHPNGKLPVAVGRSQLLTMALETISNLLSVTPHPTQGCTPRAPRIARCNAGYKSQDLHQ